MNAYVKDIMTTDVVTARPGTSYREMTAMFRQHHVSGFPVVDDDGKVAGSSRAWSPYATDSATPEPEAAVRDQDHGRYGLAGRATGQP